MPDFVNLPFNADPDDLVAVAQDYLENAIPGWERHEGNLEVVMMEAFARIAHETLFAALQVSPAVFRKFGTDLVRLPPIDPTPAIVNSTWQFADDVGRTIRAGSFVTVGNVAFQVAATVEVPAGNTQTAEGEVLLTAVEPGAAANDLTGPAEPVDAMANLQTITFVGSSAGGADGETDDEYLSRLANELTAMAPRPIVPSDYEIFARRYPAVDRAVALDGYNPDTGTFDNERTIALCVIDADGETVDALTQAALLAELQARREVNFIVSLIPPTYNVVQVSYSIGISPDADAIGVRDAVNVALGDYLAPKNWGRKAFSNDWTNSKTLRINELIAVIENVDGVDFSSNVKINNSTANLALEGAVPLTRVGGTITGTIVTS